MNIKLTFKNSAPIDVHQSNGSRYGAFCKRMVAILPLSVAALLMISPLDALLEPPMCQFL